MTLKMGRRGFVDRCLDAAEHDPILAVGYAVRVWRWKLIADGDLDPAPDEQLPVEVLRARREHAQRLAA